MSEVLGPRCRRVRHRPVAETRTSFPYFMSGARDSSPGAGDLRGSSCRECGGEDTRAAMGLDTGFKNDLNSVSDQRGGGG